MAQVHNWNHICAYRQLPRSLAEVQTWTVHQPVESNAASDLKIVKTCTSQRSPHMLDSTNICNPPILWWSQFLEGRFIIVKEDPALYPHTCLGPMIYMGTVVTKWATQWLACGSTLHTVEAIKQFVDILNKHSRRQVLAAEHPCKKHKHMSSPHLFHCHNSTI